MSEFYTIIVYDTFLKAQQVFFKKTNLKPLSKHEVGRKDYFDKLIEEMIIYFQENKKIKIVDYLKFMVKENTSENYYQNLFNDVEKAFFDEKEKFPMKPKHFEPLYSYAYNIDFDPNNLDITDHIRNKYKICLEIDHLQPEIEIIKGEQNLYKSLNSVIDNSIDPIDRLDVTYFSEKIPLISSSYFEEEKYWNSLKTLLNDKKIVLRRAINFNNFSIKKNPKLNWFLLDQYPNYYNFIKKKTAFLGVFEGPKGFNSSLTDIMNIILMYKSDNENIESGHVWLFSKHSESTDSDGMYIHLKLNRRFHYFNNIYNNLFRSCIKVDIEYIQNILKMNKFLNYNDLEKYIKSEIIDDNIPKTEEEKILSTYKKVYIQHD